MLKPLSLIALLSLSAQAFALQITPFTPAALQQAQAANKPVALHFHATWCSTCRAQEKAFLGMKDTPALKDVTLLVVDHDQEKALRKSQSVRSQSTLLVFRGERQTARLSGETDAAALQAALKSAL